MARYPNQAKIQTSNPSDDRSQPTCQLHDLRHTFASTLLSEGVSVRAVADWMGHASPMVTLNVYAHMMPIDEDRGRLVLDSALGPKQAESILRTAES
jgi:integrase